MKGNKDSNDIEIRDGDVTSTQFTGRTPYAEIAKLYDISETGAQNVVKSALNKIFNSMIRQHSDVFDVLRAMCEYFGMTEMELMRKFDDRNIEIIKKFANKHYETDYYIKKEQEKKSTTAKKRGRKPKS